MHEHAERLVGSLVTADVELEREFEARLADSSRLAFRVAFSVAQAAGRRRGRRAGSIRQGLSKFQAVA